ncbi:MAG: hypothetical protein ACI8RD_012210 [Bacillariaceae sp.]|jgi:hypothetical protein
MRMANILMAAWLCRTSMGFVSPRQLQVVGKQSSVLASASTSRYGAAITTGGSTTTRLFSVSKSNGIEANNNLGISRLETLQTMLSSHGAPGSIGCSLPDGDLEPINFSSMGSSNEKNIKDDEEPELITTMSADLNTADEYTNLHPHLYPLAKSKSTGNFICALRRAFADDNSDMYESSSNAPWPIVEAKLSGPGMRLLALNSEHYMRRIVCECDFNGERKELIEYYNKDLGKDMIKDEALDRPYEEGAVEQLGYVNKK